MLTIKLYEYGFDDVLKDIEYNLNTALRRTSKKQKNELIYKVLGEVEALRKAVIVEEYVEDEEEVDNE